MTIAIIILIIKARINQYTPHFLKYSIPITDVIPITDTIPKVNITSVKVVSKFIGFT